MAGLTTEPGWWVPTSRHLEKPTYEWSPCAKCARPYPSHVLIWAGSVRGYECYDCYRRGQAFQDYGEGGL